MADPTPAAALRFRPRFDLATGRPAADSALCRAATAAAPLAWLLLESCRHAVRRRRPVTVPLHYLPLARLPLTATLLPALDAALHATALPPECLTLELPARCRTGTATLLALSAIRDRGVGLTLTGLPDLARLHRLPLTGILLPAQAFIPQALTPQTLAAEPSTGRALLAAAILAARGIGLHVAASGITTELQRAWLHAAGCAEGEGPLFGPANPEQLDTCGPRRTAPASAHDLQPAGRARH